MEARLNAKGLAVIAVITAILVGSQFILSFAAGVEIVSLLLCVFCVVFGVRYGLITAFSFSLLRCLIFGFVPNIVVLYLIYYPCFALATGFYGKLINRRFNCEEREKSRVNRAKTLLVYVGLVIVCGVLTASFTLIDDVITPIMMGLGRGSALAYFYGSLPVLATHVFSVVVSVSVAFMPIYLLMRRVKVGMRL